MESLTCIPSQNNTKISDVAGACEVLFLECANRLLPSTIRQRAELQRQQFYVWASYLGVFADDHASLDKRLEYSDEIKSLTVQLLSVIRRNLKFRKFKYF
jgi:hypothetical protein